MKIRFNKIFEVGFRKIRFGIFGVGFRKPYLMRGDWLKDNNSGGDDWVSHWNWCLGVVYGDFEIIRKWDPCGPNSERDWKILRKYS